LYQPLIFILVISSLIIIVIYYTPLIILINNDAIGHWLSSLAIVHYFTLRLIIFFLLSFIDNNIISLTDFCWLDFVFQISHYNNISWLLPVFAIITITNNISLRCHITLILPLAITAIVPSLPSHILNITALIHYASLRHFRISAPLPLLHIDTSLLISFVTLDWYWPVTPPHIIDTTHGLSPPRLFSAAIATH